MSEIYAALAAVMADCKSVAKRDRNEHQRFLFRGIDAVVNAVGPILREHSVIVFPQVKDVHYDIVQTSTGKAATACRVVVDYVFAASDGSSLTTSVAAEAWDHGDKAAPKAMSIAFRTALLQSLALPTDDPEPDAQSYERQPSSSSQQEPAATRRMGRTTGVTQDQLKALHASFNDAGITDRDARLDYCRNLIGREITTSNELTKAEASRVIEALKQDAQEPA